VALFARTSGVKTWLTPAPIANFTRIYTASDTVLLNTNMLELAPVKLLRDDLISVRKRITNNGESIVLPKTTDGRHADFAPSLALAVHKAECAFSEYLGVDYRRFRDPNNPLNSFNEQERYVSTPNGVALVRGGTGRYPSALEY
jgi:hypothetical protein